MNKIVKLLSLVLLLFREAFLKDKIYVKALLRFKGLKFYPYNWGDDLNWLFLKEMVEENIIIYHRSLIARFWNKENYLCIGSTIEALGDSNTVVWGAGCISVDKYIPKLKKVLAVRGPLTRERLLKRGIDCPEIYGDPALLISSYYHPLVNKKWKIGVIPHYVDRNNIYVKYLERQGAKIIDLQNYTDWRDIVDQVNECEYIMSSSLHGLIVSDSYRIPNIWVEFSNNIVGDRFKYMDYYLSIGKVIQTPLLINDYLYIDYFLPYFANWSVPVIDLSKLIDVCPFKLKRCV